MKTKGSKSSRKERAAAPGPLVVEPIYVAYPASDNHERHLIVHEPAPIEAPESEEVSGGDPNAAEDIGYGDNVLDDEILPQLEPKLVSSPAPTSSEYISIGRRLTLIAQDDSWAEHQQEASPVQDETPRTPPSQVTYLVLDYDN